MLPRATFPLMRTTRTFALTGPLHDRDGRLLKPQLDMERFDAWFWRVVSYMVRGLLGGFIILRVGVPNADLLVMLVTGKHSFDMRLTCL